jgi:5,10-methylenetetrahydromethanopterin reductase
MRVVLGPGVSHLAGRHPSVIASAMATLAELAPGRIRLGIGVGDSGALNMGVPRASLSELEAAIGAMRALWRGETADGLRLGYAPIASVVPIYTAGAGERALRLSGRVADAALISSEPGRLAASIEHVRAGEREAGRPAGAVRIMLWTTVAVDEDREVARAAVRGSVARRAMNTLGALARRGALPGADLEAVQRLQAVYDTRVHGTAGHDLATLVPSGWIDRFAIAGTPDEVRTRLARAVQDGADEISMILLGNRAGERGSPDLLERFAATVLTPMRAAALA